MSKLDEIRAALANDYDSCPELAKEDAALLLAVVDAVLERATPAQKAASARRLADHAERCGGAAPGIYLAKEAAWEKLT